MKKMRPTLYSHEEMVRHLEAASEVRKQAKRDNLRIARVEGDK